MEALDGAGTNRFHDDNNNPNPYVVRAREQRRLPYPAAKQSTGSRSTQHGADEAPARDWPPVDHTRGTFPTAKQPTLPV